LLAPEPGRFSLLPVPERLVDRAVRARGLVGDRCAGVADSCLPDLKNSSLIWFEKIVTIAMLAIATSATMMMYSVIVWPFFRLGLMNRLFIESNLLISPARSMPHHGIGRHTNAVTYA